MKEMFPTVDENGDITGAVSREDAHSGSKVLHPVVHLHVFNSRGELYLQKRPAWKDIQPNRWDTAVGGHVEMGENVETALRREAFEELKLIRFVPRLIDRYVFESDRERELVYVHRTEYDGEILPDKDELDGGRFWSLDEIDAQLGRDVFTPNFEHEFKKYRAQW